MISKNVVYRKCYEKRDEIGMGAIISKRHTNTILLSIFSRIFFVIRVCVLDFQYENYKVLQDCERDMADKAV